MKTSLLLFLAGWLLLAFQASAQAPNVSPPERDLEMYKIVEAVSASRIEADVRKLASFGTRNSLSDTVSNTRGIGAARRWIRDEFEKISKECSGCLEIRYQAHLVKAGEYQRIPKDTYIVNVVAVQRGTQFPNSYVIMSGDIDSRPSDVTNGTIDSPGANDNGSGMAGVIEAARVLSKYKFPHTVIYAGLSGEEQGLVGGKFMAEQAKAEGWEIIGVLNNDMIGNIEGINGEIDNMTFRVFSEPTPVTETENERVGRRFYGGEVDGVSRQLARYVDRMTTLYMPGLVRAMMIYRLDRFGRGGHHRPFNEAGFPGVRIMETHEQYDRQHQDVRNENGRKFGDVVDGVNFDYARKLTAVNAIVLAGLAKAPVAPKNVKIGGAVSPDTRLVWEMTDDPNLAGYKIYWRETTAPQWQFSKWVGKTEVHVLRNIIIDNYLFGVAAVGVDGNESVVVFPNGTILR